MYVPQNIPALVFLNYTKGQKGTPRIQKYLNYLSSWEQQGTCLLLKAETEDILGYLSELELPERVKLLQLGPEIDPEAPSPLASDLAALEDCMRKYEGLELVILTQRVPQWFLQHLFYSGLAAVWVTRGPGDPALRRFYKRLGREKPLRKAMPQKLRFVPWDDTRTSEGESLGREGLYQRIDRKDALQWRIRRPVSIPLSKGFRWRLPFTRRWGFRIVLTALVLFTALFAAVYILPHMNRLF